MLSLEAFLARVLPSHGDFVVVKLEQGGPLHHAFPDLQQTVAKIRALETERANIYLALASYQPGKVKLHRGRTQDNTAAFRSLWLDIDCGTGKDYANQREAAAALQAFVNTTGLPAPLIVGSGGGLHVYWPFTTDVDKDTWLPLAQALKNLCLLQGLKIDVRCTTDAARILRPIETSNWKTGTARSVRLIVEGDVSSVSSLQQMLAPSVPLTPQHAGHTKVNGNPYGLATLDQAHPEDFDGQKILNGCQQMQWALHHPNEVREPMWRGIIGTLYKTDNPQLIHTVSQGYTGYDFDDTEQKAQGWKGAGVLCSMLDQEHPGGCVGCPHLGQIKSPSSIGYIAPAAPIIPIDPVTHMPRGWQHKDGILCMASDEGLVEIYGGMLDIGIPFKENGRLRVAVGTTVSGVHDFGHIDYGKINSPREFLDSLSTCGIVPETRHAKTFMAGVRSWLQEARMHSRVEPARKQLGWTSTNAYDYDASFVLGENTYRPDGTVTVVTHLIPQVKAIAQAMYTHGTLQDWQRAFNLLALPGYEAQMVMSWIAFGAPLVRFDATASAMVHAYSQNSSQGKTTALHYINSVYGNPHDANLFWTGNTTTIAVQTGLNILNGVPMGIDEITLLGHDAGRKLLYECTQQTGRKRSKQDGTMQETTMSKTMLYSTSNISLHDFASATTIDDTPLQTRMIQITFELPPMTPQERGERRALTNSVMQHYGHAGPIYVQYIVGQQSKVAKLLATVRKQLEQAIEFDVSERFQIATFAALITGATLARRLRLINHPVERGIEWIIDWFAQQRNEQQRTTNTPEGLFERMRNDLQLHIITVDADEPPPSLTAVGVGMVNTVGRANVNKELWGRYAQADNRLWLSSTQVRKWLQHNGLDVRSMLHKWKKTQLLTSLNESRVNLGKYTLHQAAGIRSRCYEFDLTQLEP